MPSSKSPESVSFIQANQTDLDVLVDLMGAYYQVDGLEVAPETTRQALAAFFSAGESWGRVYLLENRGAWVGYLALTWGYSFEYGGRVGTVDELYVQPPSRGRGFGGAALTFAEGLCKGLGMKGVGLEVEPGNEGAGRLYGHFGFRELERRLFFKSC